MKKKMALRYYIDGERVAAGSWQDGDRDGFCEQIGGSGEESAEAPVKSETMSIILQDSNGENVTFKVRKDTPFSKVFEAYAKQKGVEKQTLRFQFDGEFIQPNHTPKMCEMEDGDMITVMTHQTGGAGEEGEAGSDETPITIQVKGNDGNEIAFRVKKTTKLSKIFDAYAAKVGISLDQLRFQLDGQRINKEDTPKLLELQDNDVIDALLLTVGGMFLSTCMC
jgi:small ubiquitin-related modifier